MKEIVQAEVDIWAGDLLGRKEEAIYLQRFIENAFKLENASKSPSSFVLNINSGWGQGKTWFLTRLADQLRHNHAVVYFDAWKNDFTKDALLSFVSVICDELSKRFAKKNNVQGKIETVKKVFSKVTRSALPVGVAVLAKHILGRQLEDLDLSELQQEVAIDAADQLANVVTESTMDAFVTQRNAIDDFSKAIASLVNEIGKTQDLHLPICIVVDELDRCRPTYAIELLEAVKHLFAIHGIFFIVATDTRQLSHSVKVVYGSEFDAILYLKRFFYAEYQLSRPNYESMAAFLFEGFNVGEKIFIPSPLDDDYGPVGVFSKSAEFFKLTARDQEQAFSILKTIIINSEKNNIHYILILALIFLKVKFEGSCDDVFNHRNSAKLKKFFTEEMTNGRLQEVSIKSLVITTDSKENKKIQLRDAFEFYFRLLEGRGDLNVAPISSSENLTVMYQKNICAKLLEDKSLNSKTQRYIEKHDLLGYFELLVQAGRISVI